MTTINHEIRLEYSTTASKSHFYTQRKKTEAVHKSPLPPSIPRHSLPGTTTTTLKKKKKKKGGYIAPPIPPLLKETSPKTPFSEIQEPTTSLLTGVFDACPYSVSTCEYSEGGPHDLNRTTTAHPLHPLAPRSSMPLA